MKEPCSRRGRVHRKEEIISPVIANMTLDGLEAVVHASIGRSKLARRTAKIHVIRYADDFVVTCASKEILETQVLPAIRRFMADRGLELSDEKTQITHITEGFDFLGAERAQVRGQAADHACKEEHQVASGQVKEIIGSNASSTQEVLIRQLNPVIRGWAMYHRHAVAKEIFSLVDTHIWRLLWN